MSPVIITLLVLLGVGLLLALWLMYIYNGLVVAGNRFKNAFAQIDVQLKRRYELIPNVVEAVKGYMGHERETLDAVIIPFRSTCSTADAPSNHRGVRRALQLHSCRNAPEFRSIKRGNDVT
jgi:hypothetical protein